MVLLSYIGGKARVASKLVAVIPEDVKEIVSPFFGAGSVEFMSAKKGYIVKGYDIFPELVNFWNQLKRHPAEFLSSIEKVLPMTKEKYKQFKQQLSQEKSLHQAVMFFVVNKCSYNGIMSGYYSKTIGDFFCNSPRRIRKFVYPKCLTVSVQGFEKTIKTNPRAFLFLDPPYYEVSRTYGLKGEYSVIDHENLASLLEHHKGKWLLVYNDHPWVRKRYKRFNITCFVSRYNSNRTGEQLSISNY
jgi:DNA adenine methylase